MNLDLFMVDLHRIEIWFMNKGYRVTISQLSTSIILNLLLISFTVFAIKATKQLYSPFLYIHSFMWIKLALNSLVLRKDWGREGKTKKSQNTKKQTRKCKLCTRWANSDTVHKNNAHQKSHFSLLSLHSIGTINPPGEEKKNVFTAVDLRRRRSTRAHQYQTVKTQTQKSALTLHHSVSQ